jgi:hypothetical protein
MALTKGTDLAGYPEEVKQYALRCQAHDALAELHRNGGLTKDQYLACVAALYATKEA